MKCILCKVYGITDNEILDQFIHGLEPIISHEVLKENPPTFEKACVLAKRILQIANLVDGGDTRSKWYEPLDYTPKELDSMGAC